MFAFLDKFFERNVAITYQVVWDMDVRHGH